MHLAGGLINVGHDVLYNASIGPYSRALGTHFLQYDHVAHAYASFVIAFAADRAAMALLTGLAAGVFRLLWAAGCTG